MNKHELIKEIARVTKISQKQSQIILDTFFELIKQEVVKGNSITFLRFGRWYVKTLSSRKYYNIFTHQIYEKKERKIIFFKPSSFLLHKGTKTSSAVPIEITDTSILQYSKSSTLNLNKSIHNKQNEENINIPITTIKSGNKIVYNGELNTGKRIKHQSTIETGKLVYEGKTEYYLNEAVDIENYSYPALLIPFENIPILQYRTKRYTTGGVVEPLLVNALNVLKETEPEIEVLQNISLPVRNRTYGYMPDIAIVWRKKNLFIDIEIDEPYDIVSRKPIHYKGCGDSLRNSYFIDNGWNVIRIAEKQIVDDCSKIVDYIKYSIYLLTNDLRFLVSIDDILRIRMDRWDYADAEKWATDNFREKYLGIKNITLSSSDLEYDSLDEYLLQEPTISTIEFIKPSEDIIEDRYNDIRNSILFECKKAKYIIFTLKSKSYDYVALANEIKFCMENKQYGLKLYDVVEHKYVFIQFQAIENFYGCDNIIKQVVNTIEDWPILLKEAMIDSNPIEILYDTNDQGHPILRTVLYITPWYELYNDDNRRNYSVEILLDYANSIKFETLETMDKVGYFTGYCTYRKDIRTFNTHRVKGGRIFNCRKNIHEITVNDIWNILTKGYADMVIRMYNSLAKHEQLDLYHLGNLANALVMQGEIDEAMKIYLSIPKEQNMIGSTNTWYEACINDIKLFMTEEKHKENFEKILTKLQTHGW